MQSRRRGGDADNRRGFVNVARRGAGAYNPPPGERQLTPPPLGGRMRRAHNWGMV